MMNAEIDREQWSEASRRSYAFYYDRTHYEDIEYRCRKCSVAAAFTAEQQKIAYEVHKNYIWQRRVLCSPCHAELHRLKPSEKEFQRQWAEKKNELENDSEFIAAWLAVLEALPSYGSRVGAPMRTKLGKLRQSRA